MALNDNERLQELVLVTEDKLSLVNRNLWLVLLATVVLVSPIYYLARFGFVKLAVGNYESPKLIYVASQKAPLQITAKGIFDLGNNSYSAYAKIKNIEYDWGMPNQTYTAEFKTLGGTSVTKVNGSAFILPSSEKLIVFSRFTSDTKPEQMLMTLGEQHFIHKPRFDFSYELERVNVQTRNGEIIVSGGIKNTTPFIIKQINLPVAIYDNRNQIAAVNFTYVNDVLSGETRTFQYTPLTASLVSGSIRAEIAPEVNVFDRNIFEIESGSPSF
ncbi:MAG: hypothetical protein KW802_02725 [Candidatus Doudnabacteria bacterium]|nr:hypothetical protein [Candidatus Doudnabacteria bacterium]